LIQALDVEHYRLGEQGLILLGSIGANEHSAVPTREDSFRVVARLKQPAYCYLIAFQPDGKDVLCFPKSELEPPGPCDSLSYPERFLRVPSPGVHTFALVASNQPLPEYQRWRAGKIIWPQQPLTDEGTWRFDGTKYVQLSGGRASPAGKPEVPA